MAIPYDLERERRIILSRLAGRDVSAIARDERLSRSRVHQMLARAKSSGRYRVTVTIKSTEGVAMPEFAASIRTYLDSLGFERPADDRQSEPPPVASRRDPERVPPEE